MLTALQRATAFSEAGHDDANEWHAASGKAHGRMQGWKFMPYVSWACHTAYASKQFV
jgi:hypothetical protein